MTRGYIVKAGDTLERIARRELGDGRRWREIQALNGGLDPRRLRVGARLLIAGEPRPPALEPAVPSVPKESAPATPKVATTSYTVKSGDVLGRIAQRELGSARLWQRIVELNPGVDPNRLHVGAVLKLPVTDRPVAPRSALVAARPMMPHLTPRLRNSLVAGCLFVATLYAPENLALLHAPAQFSGPSVQLSGSSARSPESRAAAAEVRPTVRRRPVVALAGWRRAEEIHIASRPAPPEEELAGE